MRQYCNSMVKKVIHVSLITVVLVTMGGAMLVHASDHGGMPERNWNVMLGAGGMYQSEYSGSDEMTLKPLPFVMAEYQTTSLDLFIRGNKAGVGFRFDDTIPLSFSAGAKIGEHNRDNDDMAILEGTQSLDNSYELFGRVTLSTPLLDFTSNVRYVPISGDYDETARLDDDYNGLLLDVGVEKMWLKIPFLIQLGSGVTWMNSDYARANYGVGYQTELLSAFDTESGIRSAYMSANIIMFFSEHVGTALVAEGAYLLGDAADSPLTENEFQPKVGLFTFYRF